MKSGNAFSPSATAGVEEVQLQGMSSTNAPPKSLQQSQTGCQGAENVSASQIRDSNNHIRDSHILHQIVKIGRYKKFLNGLTITVCSAELVLSVLLFAFGIFCDIRTHVRCHGSSANWTFLTFCNAIMGLRTTKAEHYYARLIYNITLPLIFAILILLSIVEWDFFTNSCRMCLPEFKIVNSLEFVFKIILALLFLTSILSSLVFVVFHQLKNRYIRDMVRVVIREKLKRLEMGEIDDK